MPHGEPASMILRCMPVLTQKGMHLAFDDIKTGLIDR